MSDAPIGSAQKWAITFSVMLVTVMQVLDTSITNVALPHMQGSFSASIDEMSWVITSYLAAHATIEFLGRICDQPRWRAARDARAARRRAATETG